MSMNLVFFSIMRISIPPRWTYAMLALFNKEINIVKSIFKL